MIAQTRAEFLKIRSTRTTLGLAITMVGLVLLVTLLTGFLSDDFELIRESHQREMFTLGGFFAPIFAALAGVLVVTSEFRFGTIRPTLLYTPRRSVVIGAKVVAALLSGAVLAVVAEGLAYGIGRAFLASDGIRVVLDNSEVALILLGGLATTALWGAIGAGLGSIVHNQIASIVGLLAWLLLVENIVFGLAPSTARFGPSHAGDALSGFDGDDLLSPAAGGAVLLVWAAALMLAGMALTAARDVD